jgi:isopenicillin-N N-acyltransferase like protein
VKSTPTAETSTERPLFRRLRRMAWTLAFLSALWISYAEITLLRPPRDLPPAPTHSRTEQPDGTLRYGRSYLRRHGGVWEMGLVGDPVELGHAHATLAREIMFRVEGRMLALFSHYVPSAALRTFISTLVRGTHRTLDRNFPTERLHEIAAEARAFAPYDPFETFMPTYHRVVTLHALYDISLSFEHSPLIGCSALFASGTHSRDGHTYVGRNFDMEIEPAFDIDKMVLLFRPRGRIPFASVAWPGLTGVVTGMNMEGIFVAVHGGRASEASPHGVPVPTTLRTIMERAHTLDEAIEIARHDPPMVSHILIVVDGDRGIGAALERAPNRPLAIRPLGNMGGVSNHYTDATLAADPKNQTVRRNTSTLARQTRLDELTAENDGRFDPETMLAVLRDRRGPANSSVPLGHRGTMDAWIATHSVIADATDRVLWVSSAPHTLGAYERFDLRELLADEYTPETAVQSRVLPPDPALSNGLYSRWEQARALIEQASTQLDRKEPAGALERIERALSQLPEGDMDALRIRAQALTALSRRTEAVQAWQNVLRAHPSSPAEIEQARSALQSLGVPATE